MSELVRDLCALIAPDRVLHSREDLLAYGYDGTAAIGGFGAAVVMARTTDEVQKVVTYAAKHGIALYESEPWVRTAEYPIYKGFGET